MNFKHKTLGSKSYKKKLPQPTHEPIRIDDAKIENGQADVYGINDFKDIFNHIRIPYWTSPFIIRAKSDFTKNVYYQYPDVMNKYRNKKFTNPPKCPRCSGNHHIDYQGHYISHNVDYHGASFSIVIQEIERILQ